MIRTLMTAVAATVLLAGCSSSAESSTDSEEVAQTWETPYAETTCDQWSAEMNADEQLILSADVIAAHWETKGVEVEERPSPALALAMAGAISDWCDVAANMEDDDRVLAAAQMALSADEMTGDDRYAP